VGRTRAPIFDIVEAFSEAADLVDPALVNHHLRVAYIALSLAEELGLPEGERERLLLAGMLHDIGALELKERLNSLKFEFEAPHRHARIGYLLLRDCEFLSEEAKIIRFHHVPWEEGRGREFEGEEVPMLSHLIHLADRVAVLIRDMALGGRKRFWPR